MRRDKLAANSGVGFTCCLKSCSRCRLSSWPAPQHIMLLPGCHGQTTDAHAAQRNHCGLATLCASIRLSEDPGTYCLLHASPGMSRDVLGQGERHKQCRRLKMLSELVQQGAV